MGYVDIYGYYGAYRVNESGDVISVARRVEHGRAGFISIPTKKLKQTVDASGYPTVSLWIDGCRSSKRIHSVS